MLARQVQPLKVRLEARSLATALPGARSPKSRPWKRVCSTPESASSPLTRPPRRLGRSAGNPAPCPPGLRCFISPVAAGHAALGLRTLLMLTREAANTAYRHLRDVVPRERSFRSTP